MYYCDKISSCFPYRFQYFSFLFTSFSLARDVFSNHCSLKSAVVYQAISKLSMFTFVVSYIIPFLVFFPLNGGKQTRLLYFWWENTKEGAIFKREKANHPWMKLWHRGKEVLIYKMFDLTREENIKKTRKAITHTVDILKL